MTHYPSNQERTAEYLENFNREKTLKFLLSEEHPIIFDVGANIGTSLDEFKDWWPGSIVHCFEPQEECWDSLDKKAKKYNNAFINKYAVGNNHNQLSTFYSHDLSSGISGFNKVNLKSKDSLYLNKIKNSKSESLQLYEDSLNHERKIKINRLDEYTQSKNIEKINLLKIDTQGYEPEVIEGLGDNINRVDVVITELMFYDYYERSLSFFDIERFLIPAGFRLYDINHIAKNPMNGRTDWVDVIYVNDRVRSAKHAEK
jgi:FkbM family methyltransferase